MSSCSKLWVFILTSMEKLSVDEVMGLIKRASAFKAGTAEFDLEKQTFASNLFFENSTRTHHSFHIAERKLGLDVLEFDAQARTSNATTSQHGADRKPRHPQRLRFHMRSRQKMS